MIFPFGIEKEAEIYCTSTKVALKSQEKKHRAANCWYGQQFNCKGCG